jgi:hypothetical protein
MVQLAGSGLQLTNSHATVVKILQRISHLGVDGGRIREKACLNEERNRHRYCGEQLVDFHLEHGLRLQTEPAHKPLYSWAINEIDGQGQ